MAGPLTGSVYTSAERNGVVVLIGGGFLSMVAIAGLLLVLMTFRRKFSNTHFLLYFFCLLLADAMQAMGAIMNISWVQQGGVYDGPFCVAQGVMKQAGSVAAAVWSFTISFHIFDLLFLRHQTSKLVSRIVVALGWLFVIFVVIIGPLAVQTKERGPYFGISGEWCWITHEYRLQQITLQYLFEGLSILLSVFLYTATLLRVRGNLLKFEGRWKLRFLPSGEAWRLNFTRDFTDKASLAMAQHMVWYPVAYALLILPIAIVRISAFAGSAPPFSATVFSGFIFDLCGLVDVVLFVILNRLFPEAGSVPEFSARRKTIDARVMENGITPFALDRPVGEPAEKPAPSDGDLEKGTRMSVASFSSINSQTPLRP